MNTYFLVTSTILVLLSGCQSLVQAPSYSQLTLKPRPQIHGHRGSRGTHPENTLSALEESVESGADWVEIDLNLAKGDVPIVSHDPTVSVDFCLGPDQRPLKRPSLIRTLTVTQLKKFDCGSVPNPLFPEQKPVPDQRLLTLEEVLIWAKSKSPKKVQLNIEAKMSGLKNQYEQKAFVRAILALLKKHQYTDNVLFQSFDLTALREAKLREPGLKLSALFETGNLSICEETKKLGAQIISPAFHLLRADLIQGCHRLGIAVHPWTLNRRDEWRQALAWGVDGIITDYPRRLIQFLNEENK